MIGLRVRELTRRYGGELERLVQENEMLKQAEKLQSARIEESAHSDGYLTRIFHVLDKFSMKVFTLLFFLSSADA